MFEAISVFIMKGVIERTVADQRKRRELFVQQLIRT